VTAQLPPPRRTSSLDVVRLASVPFADPYVDAVLPFGVVRVGPPTGPNPWLDVAHLEAHAADLDVLHLHTGSARVAELAGQCWTEQLRRLGIPLVVTVHGLVGDGDRARFEAHLAAVLADAEVVLTLTPGAADEIAGRFGRTAIVVAHPSVTVPDPELGSERGLVGLRLDPTVPDPVLLVRAALSGAVSGGGRLRVLVDEAAAGRLDPEVAEAVGRGELELVVHPHAERPAQLQQLHVAVLPERLGTHSRDLEICRDVGTRVVAPGRGWFPDQWADVVGYGTDEAGVPDPVSVSAAVAAALTRPMPRPADRAWRAEQQAAVARVHADVYRQLKDPALPTLRVGLGTGP
jgi:Glycosyltransferase Family 4